MSNTSNRLRDKVDDEIEVVARNVRESKDRMGEMKRKFEMAMEKMSHLKLEDFDKLHLAVQKAEASPYRAPSAQKAATSPSVFDSPPIVG